MLDTSYTIDSRARSSGRFVLLGITSGLAWALTYGAFMFVLLCLLNRHNIFFKDLITLAAAILAWFSLQGVIAGALFGVIAAIVSPRLKGKLDVTWLIPLPFIGKYLYDIILTVVYNRSLFNNVLLQGSAHQARDLAAIFAQGLIFFGLALLVWFWMRRPKSNWRAGLAAALIPVCIAACLVYFSALRYKYPFDDLKPEAQSIKPAPTGIKVMILGIDAADWKIFRAMSAEGLLPAWTDLMNRGASGEMATIQLTRYQRIWTTIATGKSPELHGIDFHVEPVPGTRLRYLNLKVPSHCGLKELWSIIRRHYHVQQEIASSFWRMEKALWNIISDAGYKVGTVNWWATWPAEQVNGVIVSDRLFYFRDLVRENVPPSTKALTYPEDIFFKLAPIIVKPENVSSQELQQYARVTAEEAERMKRTSYHHHSLEAELPYLLAMDETYRKILEKLIVDRPDTDFWAIYFRGLDIISHYGMKYMDRLDDKSIAPDDKIKYGPAVEKHYQYFDRLIKELSAALGPGYVIILCSDHGFEREAPGYSNHHNAPPAMLIMQGYPIIPGSTIKGTSVYDIAPTALYLMGLPRPKDMPGRVLTEVIDQEFRNRFPVRETTTYGPQIPIPRVPEDEQVDKEITDQLRALGYIK